ncbi:hypothetical protein GCM10022631_22240 [Deinococcus rubellus]
MTASIRRRVDKLSGDNQERWHAAWAEWHRAAILNWRRSGDAAGEQRFELLDPLHQEWAAAYFAGELPSFLARGAALAKWWESAPRLWGWLWKVEGYYLEHNVRIWPKHLLSAPAVSAEGLTRLLAEASSSEDMALIFAVMASCEPSSEAGLRQVEA